MNKTQEAVTDLVESWINGNLEYVAKKLEKEDRGFLVDFISLLIKERHGLGSEEATNPPLNYDGWLDLARLSKMLK